MEDSRQQEAGYSNVLDGQTSEASKSVSTTQSSWISGNEHAERVIEYKIQQLRYDILGRLQIILTKVKNAAKVGNTGAATVPVNFRDIHFGIPTYAKNQQPTAPQVQHWLLQILSELS